MGDTGGVKDTAARGCAAAGIAGPVVFTGAWVVGSLRQTGHRAAGIQISGLAASDARDPWIMIAGFLALGGCTVALGSALRDALGGHGVAGPAPRLIQGAGVLTIAAGLLRRDRMLLISGSVSWHNHAHDVISAVIYVDLVLAQMLLAARFGRDPGRLRWKAWRPWLVISAAATAGTVITYAAATSAPGTGTLQRVAVSIPLAVIAAIALRLIRTAGSGTGPHSGTFPPYRPVPEGGGG